ncbi:MAG: glycosyltransferase [Actinobacteria bacterium]|nr:glycosyltransferase [Actinomycetota bacterium]
MTVAMVSEHASPLAVLGGVDAGGQNVHVAALATAMAQLGNEVVVHTRREDPDMPRRVQLAPGVVVDHVDAGPARPVPKDELLPYMDDFATELRRRWRTDRPDVVHAHFWMSGKASLDAAWPIGIPVVQTFHALGVVKRRNQGAKDTSPPEREDVERSIVERCDHIVATCSDELFELLRLGGDASRISIVPCGVDVRLFTPDGPAESRPTGRHRLVVVSRLVERKGIGNVIEALVDIPDTELVVAGGPPREELRADAQAARLLALADSYGVADRVDFRGRVDRNALPALYRSADAVVCVPWYEPFGIVPLEAMACGVPVIASAVGGLVDSVVDGLTGVHVPTRRPDAVAEVARDLLSRPAKRRALGRAGATRARKRFAWSRVAMSTLATYAFLPAAAEAGAGRSRQ